MGNGGNMMSISVSGATYQIIHDLAEKRNVSMSTLLDEMIQQGLDVAAVEQAIKDAEASPLPPPSTICR